MTGRKDEKRKDAPEMPPSMFEPEWLRAAEEPYKARDEMSGLGGSTTESAEVVLRVCRRIVAAQAEDDALWGETMSISEAYVRQELRTLSRAVDGFINVAAAVEEA